MTNHWRDIKNADLILINGANPAEAHPVGFQWFMRAKLDRAAKMIHADPRFSRTSAVSDLYLRIRTGTDVAYFGGLINYVLQHDLHHAEYVTHYTNAAFLVKEGYAFQDGLFRGHNKDKPGADTSAWAYEGGEAANAAFDRAQKEALAHGEAPPTGAGVNFAKRDETLQDPRTVF